MKIEEFIRQFNNHPVLFVGTGISLRYLENSYSWEDLLKKISRFISGNEYHFEDLKAQVYNPERKEYDFPALATLLEDEFNEAGKYQSNSDQGDLMHEINELYYKSMREGHHTSRLKIFISLALEKIFFKEETLEEISEFKKARKNISSVITTNYDQLIEEIFNFTPLLGNDILLSNPYGSVYKIHGSVEEHNSLVITEQDYKDFEIKYELIRAQLISLFIHNPIIFIGYSISDDNVKKILKTIFSYVDYDDKLAEKIRSNFLLVEYQEESKNGIVTDYDINIDNTTISINKIATDDYLRIYKAIANLSLSISAMEIRKVRNIVADIYKGSDTDNIPKVRITEDIDNLSNSDKVLAIGTENTISYEFRTIREMIIDYFNIIEENNFQILNTIDRQTISSNQYFPIYAFSEINNRIRKTEELKNNQTNKIMQVIDMIPNASKEDFTNIKDIINNYSSTNRQDYCVIWNVIHKNINLEKLEKFIKKYGEHRGLNRQQLLDSSDYKRLVTVYDYYKYKE